MKEIEILSIPIIEWIGYIASVLVLVSLSLSSILRLRIFNLIGSAVFSLYGFLIGSMPVGFMNLIIVFANLYYLQKIYSQKDKFELIETESNQEYIQKFLIHFKKDIEKYFPEFELKENSKQVVIMVMRNMNLSGLFIAQSDSGRLEIKLDYVTPQYRDFKNGAFIFSHLKKALKLKEYKTIVNYSDVNQQVKYLKKMGFKQDSINSKLYTLNL